VTVDDVEDEVAGKVGQQATMLLDTGIPLYGVLDVLGRTGTDRSRYTLLGNPTLTLHRSTSSFGIINSFGTGTAGTDDDSFPTTTHVYPAGENTLGTYMTPSHIETDNQLASAKTLASYIPREELAHHLEEDPLPTLLDGDLVLNTELSLDDFDA
jgi:hypothetical protein